MALDVQHLDDLGTPVFTGEYDDVAEWFETHGIALPPVPKGLRNQLRQQHPWVWSTMPVDPWRLVDHDRALGALSALDTVDHLTVGLVGRHSERSRIVYQLAHRGLAVVASCPWRPDERDHYDHDREIVDQTFFAIGALLDNLADDVEVRLATRPGVLIEVHGRSVRWWRPDHEPGPFTPGPDADGCWHTLAHLVCVDRPSWRVRVLDQLPRA